MASKTKREVRELNGYRLIYEPDHPSAMQTRNWHGYVYEHRYVVEASLGRRLRDNECVHHLDGNRANNRTSNLLVIDRSQHRKLHLWLEAGAPMVKVMGENRVNSGEPTVEPRYCKACGRTLQQAQKAFCSAACSWSSKRKAERPTKQKLIEDLRAMSRVAVGRMYGVSDTAIKKWALQYGITKAILSQAPGTPGEGAETSGEV